MLEQKLPCLSISIIINFHFQICCPNPKQTICLPGDITCDPNADLGPPPEDYDEDAYYDYEYPEDYGSFIYTVEGDDQSEIDGPPCDVTKPIKDCSQTDFNKEEPPYLKEFDEGEFNTMVFTKMDQNSHH